MASRVATRRNSARTISLWKFSSTATFSVTSNAGAREAGAESLRAGSEPRPQRGPQHPTGRGARGKHRLRRGAPRHTRSRRKPSRDPRTSRRPPLRSVAMAQARQTPREATGRMRGISGTASAGRGSDFASPTSATWSSTWTRAASRGRAELHLPCALVEPKPRCTFTPAGWCRGPRSRRTLATVQRRRVWMPSVLELVRSSSPIFTGTVVERGLSTVPALKPSLRLRRAPQPAPAAHHRRAPAARAVPFILASAVSCSLPQSAGLDACTTRRRRGSRLRPADLSR